MGGTKYHRYAQTEKFKQAEQKLDKTKDAEKLVAALFETEAKERLAKDITEKQLSIALGKVNELPDSPLKKELLTEVKSAEEGYQAQKEVQALLAEDILADEVTESQLKQAQAHLEKIKKRFPLLYDELNISLSEAKEQYEAIKKAGEALTELFEESQTETVKDSITQEQYDEVKAMIAAIKNKKAQAAFFETLVLVETKLSAIEQQLLQEQEEQERALEEERLAEQERMEAAEEEAALQEEAEQEKAATSASIESNTTNQNTWQPAPNTTKSPQSNWTPPQKNAPATEPPAKENSSDTVVEPESSSDSEILEDSEAEIDSSSNDEEEPNQESSAFSSAD